MENKKAILVVSFGTSHHETCDKNIGAIEKEIAAAYPDWEIRRAFTSGMIIRKLKKRDGISVDTVEEALERLLADDFTTVLCQPTHIINGMEYDDILEAVTPYMSRFQVLTVGSPLLTSTLDYRDLCAAIGDLFPDDEKTALCLMGHGSEHFSDCAYAALDYHFKDMNLSHIHVGTVEGFPDLETVLEKVRCSGAKKVILTPLMVVAGDHAVNDMASDEEDSWKTAFESAGFDVVCILKGLGEYPTIREIYLRHIREALSNIS